jgi:hypothetical protein
VFILRLFPLHGTGTAAGNNAPVAGAALPATVIKELALFFFYLQTKNEFKARALDSAPGIHLFYQPWCVLSTNPRPGIIMNYNALA